MNPTSFHPERRGNGENKSHSPVNIRFVVKTSDIRNFSQNITFDVKTSEVATLVPQHSPSSFGFQDSKTFGHTFIALLGFSWRVP